MNPLKFDLKVCEGCGALWLRTNPAQVSRPVSGRVYCRRCALLFADFPPALGLRRGARRTARRTAPHIRLTPPAQLQLAGGVQ